MHTPGRLSLLGMKPAWMGSILGVALVGAACGPQRDEGQVMGAGHVPDIESTSKSLMRQCADGPTIRGIDVSYYQQQPDWNLVANDDVRFAFIRVSDGLVNIDSEFDRNWREARRVGIRRGAYQFFRPNLDPIAQADLLVDRMGALESGDLPPVIDVEATGGLTPANVAARVHTWIERVQARIGVVPIIYTAPYFCRDNVGSPSYSTEHHLWLAHYTTACPLVPEPWSRFTFHQYTDSGSVAGIIGSVDMNIFNGTLADLDAITLGGEPPPPPPRCEVIGQNGRILEERDACVTLGGPAQFLRTEPTGHGGEHVWTGATSSSQTVNFATYTLSFDAPAEYQIEAFVPAGGGTSQQTRYEVTHLNGQTDVVVDQSNADGFVNLGAFEFDTGTAYTVHIADNTGEASSLGRRIVFDALRVMPAHRDPQDPTLCTANPIGGGIVEEDGACAELGGPTQYLRAESGGHGGGYVWTGATSSQQAVNYARWALGFEVSGDYRIEAYVDGLSNGARWARYHITHANGNEDVYMDHSTASGFVELGTFEFGAGGGYGVRVDDNTGESTSLGRRLVFDAIRATRVTTLSCTQVGLVPGVEALNVRPLPNTDKSPVGLLSSGEVAERLATVSGAAVNGDTAWHRVRVGGTIGYISGYYVSCIR